MDPLNRLAAYSGRLDRLAGRRGRRGRLVVTCPRVWPPSAGLTWPPKAREMSSAPVGMKMTEDLPAAAIFCSVSRMRICAERAAVRRRERGGGGGGGAAGAGRGEAGPASRRGS